MQYNYTYDLFISHAVEDKIPLVNELAARLEAQGIKVWYTGRELSIGDGVCDTLVEGMRQSRYGIIIFSPSYISKMKPSDEFTTLINYKRQGRKVIIPVLFGITPGELVVNQLLPLENNAIYSDNGLDAVVHCLLQDMDLSPRPRPESISAFQKFLSGKGKLYAAIIFAVGLLLILYGFSMLLM
jgi:hypothetical protein